MKSILLILIGAFAAYMILRSQRNEEATKVDEPPQHVAVLPSTPLPQISPVPHIRSKRAAIATPKATPAPRSLATIVNPTFIEVFGHNDRDARRIVRAANDVSALPSKLRLAADANDAVKMGTALRLCSLMQQAVDRTAAGFAEEERDRNFRATMMTRDGREQIDAFFYGTREKAWLQNLSVLRQQAAAILPSLGWPEAPSVEEKNARELREKAENAQEIEFEVLQVLPGGVIVDLYRRYAVAGEATRHGAGGNVGYDSAPSGKNIFLEGFKDGTEGQRAKAKAYRDGAFHFEDGISRTLEKWIVVSQ